MATKRTTIEETTDESGGEFPLFPNYDPAKHPNESNHCVQVYRVDPNYPHPIRLKRYPDAALVDETIIAKDCKHGSIKCNLNVTVGNKTMVRKSAYVQLPEESENTGWHEQVEYADQIVTRIMALTDASIKANHAMTQDHIRETLAMFTATTQMQQESHQHALGNIIQMSERARNNESTMYERLFDNRKPPDVAKIIAALATFAPLLEMLIDKQGAGTFAEKLVAGIQRIAATDTFKDIVGNEVAGIATDLVNSKDDAAADADFLPPATVKPPDDGT